jgi:nucleoside-diphosphate-sugar epimerase
MNVLVTGASGFVGGFIVEYALEKDWNVFAAVRKSSNRQYLADSRIQFVELDFSSEEIISSSLEAFHSAHGNIDYVIHNAGVTKAINISAYDQVNFSYTTSFIRALQKTQHEVKKFTFVSSMAAAGPGSEKTFDPIKTDDNNDPVSAYGWSKKKAETFIEQECEIPFLILRPPPVFGPRDKDMFAIFEIVNKGFELYIGRQIQRLSFIYVKDLARGIVEATLSPVTNKKYFLSDNKPYDNAYFHSQVKKALGKKTLKFHLPISIVYIVSVFSEWYTKLTGQMAKLSREALKEFKCLNWVCDSSNFYQDISITPKYTLIQAIEETATWYKEQKWLK